jgi:uncharacterized protein (DUF305 family)
MVCGGAKCTGAVQLWDTANMKMHRGMALNFTGDPSVDFVRGMIPHHEGATDMCDVLVKKLSCEENGGLSGLVHFCQHVRFEQEFQLAEMRQWLAERGFMEVVPCVVDSSATGSTTMDRSMNMGCGNTSAISSQQFIEANRLMHGGMKIDLSCEHDVDFVRGMIPHHGGAVLMCEILSNASAGQMDDYLARLCANITRVQRAEIAFLSDWLLARNHSLTAPCCTDKKMHSSVVPCEDQLVVSSFCHVLGGDFFCTCENVLASYKCGSTTSVAGFGELNVSAECLRTCDLCPAERLPVLQDLCASTMHHDHEHTENRGEAVSSAAFGFPSKLIVYFLAAMFLCS